MGFKENPEAQLMTLKIMQLTMMTMGQNLSSKYLGKEELSGRKFTTFVMKLGKNKIRLSDGCSLLVALS